MDGHRTPNGAVEKLPSHLVMFETRDCSVLNIPVRVKIRGTLDDFESNIRNYSIHCTIPEDFVLSMRNSLEFCIKYVYRTILDSALK